MRRFTIMLAVTVAADLTLAGCTERPASSAASLPQSAAVEPAAERDVGFVNRVWQVRTSSAGDPGAFYVFLADGTLLIASSHGTPMIGSWKQEKESVLTMVEEGIPYRVAVLKLAPGELRLRSHNPGQPVEMTLVPAGPGAPPARPETAASPAPQADLEQRYVPLSRVTETWGMLRLSRTSARIAAFAGSMRLEHAGVMSTSAGSDLAGAEVFRIVNAEDYFARNKGRNAFCAELPRWLAVRHASSDARTAGEIWVALLTVTDWDAYRPDVPGYCAGGLYAPEAGNG